PGQGAGPRPPAFAAPRANRGRPAGRRQDRPCRGRRRTPGLQHGHDELRARAAARPPRRSDRARRQHLLPRGAVPARALDSGTSTTMAFDGKLINRPSDPAGERGVADGLFVFYYGVQAPAPATDVLSPNGDGVDESQELSYKVVRPSTVTASL